MAERLQPHELRGYALGSVATGAFGTVPGLLLLPYLTDRLGVGAAVAGIIVFVPKFWDVILNPIAGRIADRSTGPGGRRRPFILRGGLLLALFFALMFAGPTHPPTLAAAWVVLAFVACATAYSFFQVPYLSMPAEMTDDYAERTRIMSWRVAVLAVAILVSGGVAPLLRTALGAQWGYVAVGVFVGVLILIGTLGAWWGTRTVALRSYGASEGSLRQQLAVVAASPDFRAVLGTFVVQALATGAMLAGVDYVARYLLGSSQLGTVLFLCFVAPAIVVTPLWERFSRRHGKTVGYAVATVVMGTAALLSLPAVTVSLTLGAVVVAVIGVGYAGCQMFPMSMLPDIAAVDAARTGTHRVGTYTGVWTAGETLGFALGPMLYAAVLASGGYVSSTDAAAQQPASALTAIGWGFAYLPGAIILLSLVILRRYTLTSAQVAATTKEPL